MFSGPMFRYEYHATTRKRRPFVFRALIAFVLGVATLFVGFLVLTANPRSLTQDQLILFGRSMFVTTFCLEMLFLVIFVPGFVGGSIADERSRDTLPLLLLTRLTRIEIVLTKATARWLSAVNLILTGLPVLIVSAWSVGLEREMLLAIVVLLSSSAFMATLSILASAVREPAGTARGQAFGWIIAWLIGPPALSIIPVRSGNLWGLVLTELKSLCAFLAPSSPLSLLTDHGWYRGTGALNLEMRVALMVGLQILLGLLALVGAASRLQARETNPNWLDPTRGYRPPCGDDPIYWREYELPTRRGGGSVVALRIRYVVILIKAVLINTLTLVAMILALAVPLGLLFATIYYGFGAFEELRQYGYGPAGPLVERSRFNLLVRAATGLLGLFPSMFQTTLVGTRIVLERDKKTWDTFLTTPLSGREILLSKTRVAIDALKTSWPLLIVWGLGLAFGVVTPLGVLFVAADLVLLTWAFLALTLYWNLRPGPTSVAASRSSSSGLILFFVHFALLAALLASPWEFAAFGASAARTSWAILLTGLTIMIVTGALAWVVTRRTFDRFDEWAGRPISSTTPQPVPQRPGLLRFRR
jgi:hypothetical protein